MNCPRCQTPLTPGQHSAGGVMIDLLRCDACTGHWLESKDLHSVEEVVDVHLVEWHHLPGVDTQGRILFCPRCADHQPMEKVLSRRDKRVVMDVCAKCKGVWLDYGELEAIEQKGLMAALADVFKFIRST